MKATLLFLFLCITHFGYSQNTYLVSQQYGYSATDATSFLQAALNDPTASTIVIDNLQGSTWITDGLLLNRDNVTIQFQNGVVIEALANALGEFEPLLNIRGCNNILIEGNGGTMRMDKSQYPTSSQFRHCILTRGPDGVTIQDLTLTGAAGDGVEVGPDFVVDVNDIDNDGDVTDFVPTVPSRNITLTNLICDANNRQGMSIVSVIGLTVTNCTFSNTAGTEPESGIDFEPFQSYQPMQNILMTGCTFSGNNGNGIQFGGVDINAQSPPSSIVIDGATIFGNGQNTARTRSAVDINNIYNPFAGADQTMNAADVGSAPGTFVLRNSLIRDEPFPGLNVRQYATGLDVTFENVTVQNAANTFVNANLGPIIVQPPFYGATLTNEPCFGNVAFTNVTLIDDQTDRAQVTVSDLRSGPTGPADVTGNIAVSLVGAAAGSAINYVDDPQNCGNYTLTVTAASVLPVTLTRFAARQTEDCTHEIGWEVSLAAALSGFAIEHSADGRSWATVWQQAADDQSGLGTHRASVPGETAAFYRLRSDFVDGPAEYSEVVYAPACAGGSLTVWPNPAHGTLYVSPAEQPRTFTLTAATGRRVRQILMPAGTDELSVEGLPAGWYVLSDGLGGRVPVLVR